MELPEPDPSKLLQSWMEWERGEVTPGRVMATLKTGGLRQLLEGLVAQGEKASPGPDAEVPDQPGEPQGTEPQGTEQQGTEQQGTEPASWSPVV
jgi:hypothetical protein